MKKFFDNKSHHGNEAKDSKGGICAMSDQDSVTEKSDWLLVNPKIMLGFLGAVACFSWLFLALGTSHFIPYAAFSGLLVGAVHLCFLLGIALALFIVWRASDFFTSHKEIQYGISIVLTVAGCGLLYFAELTATWGWLFGFIMGCGFGFIYVLYGEYICTFFNSAFKPYVYAIFACAILACTGSLFVGQSTSYWFALIFPCVALLAYGFSLVFFRLGKLPVANRKASDSRVKVTWRSYLSTATAGLAAGFAFGSILSTQTAESWVYILIFLTTFAVCLFLFIDSLRDNKVSETTSMRWFLPFSAIIVFPMIFVPDQYRFVFAVLLLCWSLLPICLSLSAICKHIFICKLSPLRAFSFGRIMTILGLALGFVIGFLGFSDFSVGILGSYVSIVAVIFYMILIIFSSSFVMVEDNYPDESRFRRIEKALDGFSQDIIVTPGTPIRKLANAQDVGNASGEKYDNHRPGVFYQKCEVVAGRYDLSSRQKEVLAMLAKGRNAEYITEKLVISSHTAKAHIYNIYQKTGVHSRQELMDLVEEVEIL